MSKKTPLIKIDVAELAHNFRTAKDKRMQIEIEADLHCCAPRVIAEELYKAGELKGTDIMPWQFSDMYVPVPPAQGSVGGRKLSFDEARAMELFTQGVSYTRMGRKLGVSDAVIKKWVARRGLSRKGARCGRPRKDEVMMQNTDEKFEEIVESVDAGKRCVPCEPTQPECGDCAVQVENTGHDAWQGYTVPQPLRECDVMSVGDFVSALGHYLTESIADAPLSINGTPLRHDLEFTISVRNEQVFVDLLIRGCA